MRSIILASASPRRKALLEQIGLSCKVVPSKIEKRLNPRLKPRGQAEALVREKAQHIAEKYAGQEVIIIAADTLMEVRGETLEKPKSAEDAKRMLRKLSGTVHSAISAFTILDTKNNKQVTKSSATKIYLRKLSQKEIDGYVASGEGMSRAGAWAIDGVGAVFVEKIEGDFYTVMGLPLKELTEELKRFGVTIF